MEAGLPTETGVSIVVLRGVLHWKSKSWIQMRNFNLLEEDWCDFGWSFGILVWRLYPEAELLDM
jgi:hypothetical protein